MTSLSLLSLRFRFWTCFLNFRAAAAVVDVVAVGGVVVDLLVLDDDDTVRLGADELARFEPDWLPVWKITNTCDHVRSKKHQVF